MARPPRPSPPPPRVQGDPGTPARPTTGKRGPPSAGRRVPGPSRADLDAARDHTLTDLVAPGLRVLFCGINPGLYSAATGWHFGRPGNRFWPALRGAGFTERQFHPCEQHDLLALGIGVTNLVPRTTATAASLSDEELRQGRDRLDDLVESIRPRWLAVLGVSAYRVAFMAPGARVGRQPLAIGPTQIWVLPNPSGLNAHYQLPLLVEAFTACRHAVFGEAGEPDL